MIRFNCLFTHSLTHLLNHSITYSLTRLFSVVILDVIERTKKYGIECLGPKGDGIIFLAGQWRPGGEYVQKLIVRNVSTSGTHSLTYSLSKSID